MPQGVNRCNIVNEHDGLTFSQRHGYAEVPRPFQLEELPPTARVAIWNALYVHLANTLERRRHIVGGPWVYILISLHVHHDRMPLDEWRDGFELWRTDLRNRIEQLAFNHVFDLIEFITRHRSCPRKLMAEMAKVFGDCQLAYTIDVGPPPTIVQAATPEEGKQLTENLKELRAGGLHAATTHLHSASKCINDRDWAGSVRESINAVESVARQIDPAASRSLKDALRSLEKRELLPHQALKGAFNQLYGYTSDEQGIRHPLLEKTEPNVTINEAVFMLGACASFASYLWRKHIAANSP